MASSSSSLKSFTYDAFLSFRGEDTRSKFVDHLYHVLHNSGIITYKDENKMERGEEIRDQLMRSIEDSRFFIIVFSKNYASSSWCLNELVKIMECQKTIEQTAYPVFYDVEPTEIRKQSGAFGEAFSEHVGKDDEVRWRKALNEAADLAGWEWKTTPDGREANFIHKIVKDISLKLHFINGSVDKKLVGMENQVRNVVSSLELDFDDVRMIGIKGMGGGGKTTLARAVFDHISIWFDGKCFVENVREGSKGFGLKELQKQVLKDVLNDQNIDATSVYDGKNKMKKMMGSRKVLVVLDDVNDIEQLEALAGETTWFKPGSRIIITTRDEQVLKAHRVKSIYDISLLSDDEAICLFSRCAFGREIPSPGYEYLSHKVVYYAAGLPLTITVLGSFLCGRKEREWVDAIERLKRIPLKETLEKLELSYNGLENDQKEIFLDVACMLKGEPKDEATRRLESCGFHAQIGLKVLEQKSLINNSDHGYLDLHDHIEEMGMNIVRRLHPEPSRHNRLWIKDEIEEILVNESGTEAIRCIKLKNTDLHTTILMKGLRNMRELRFLYVDNGYREWKVDEGSQYLPDSLQSVYWHRYPFRCLPKTFRANKLVNLEMKWSKISQLWEAGERKVLKKLRFINLSDSKLRTFDLEMTPYLETLDLANCSEFVELNMPGKCLKLKIINLVGSKLSNFNLGLTPYIEKLNLGGCNDFVKLHMPIECPKLKFLNLSGSKVSNHNLGRTPYLKTLNLEGCNEFVEFHMPSECPKLKLLNVGHSKLSNFNLDLTPHLEKLNLEGCNELIELHIPRACPNLRFLNLSGSKVSNLNLGMTTHLKTLNLKGCNEFVELYMPIECPKLESLDLSGSKVTNFNIGMTPRLAKLYLRGCNAFKELEMHAESPFLELLNISGSKVTNFNLGMTPHLSTLHLEGCNEFVDLHIPVECPELEFLDLSSSKVSNLNLGLTPSLEILDLNKCYYLQEIQAPVGCLKKLVFLNLSGCPRFKYFLVDKLNESPGLDSVATLELSAESIEICPLHPNSDLPPFQFKCFYDEGLPSSSGNIEKLISFGLCACTNLESFSATICGLQYLRVLTLEGSIPEVPNDLWLLESLEKLTLSLKEIKNLPDSICMLKNLKYLNLKYCWLLEKLPKELDQLEGLEELDLTHCISLRNIPNSICNMKCLKELIIEGPRIWLLPQSIFQLKGLHIVWYRGPLEWYGFKSSKEVSRYTVSCHIK